MKNTKESAAEKYWREAKLYVARHGDPDDPWFVLERNDEAYRQWEKYFSWRLGTMPAGLLYLRQGKINTFLVPCENPVDFDPSYTQRSNTSHDVA